MRRVLCYAVATLLLVALYGQIFMELMRYEGQLDNVDPVTSIYWVITTMTTVGYGDVVFTSLPGRVFSSVVGLSGIFILFAVAFPLIVTPGLERLSRELPSKAPPKMRDHIIICGYNPIVEALAENFKRQKVPFLVIERSEETARKISKKYQVVWGDPAEKNVLASANIQSAKLLIANERDERNADIALTAREISEVEVVALAEDLARARFLSYAGASRIISPKSLLGTFIAQITSPPRKGVFPGAVKLFGGVLAELPIYPGSPLIGKEVHDPVLSETGARVVGMWQRGRFVSIPGEEVIRSHSVLMAVGKAEALDRLRDLTIGPPRKGPLMVIGYGDVGRRIVNVLLERGVSPSVVDKRELCDVCFRHVAGDGTTEEVLIESGAKEAVGILIMLNDDSDVVFSTLLARNLNGDAFIVARANHLSSAEKIYRAGADYVASVPIVASQMLAKIAQKQEEEFTMIYEELEMARFRVGFGSRLDGRSLGELNLPERLGCTVVAIERDGKGILSIGPETVVERGDLLAVMGSFESIEKFSRRYRWRNPLRR
ncbi:MAG TPA: NAD-binding protein [Methanothrix sp.]|nr:NAD-binding protein [Methanothrix sp.]HPJ85108.1 NAD-binding protein [Methanothrix sp.]HPR66971.1 NAD-binding protein [Methanothrix sp.]